MTDEEMRKTYYGGYRNPGQSMRGAHTAGLRAVADAAKGDTLAAAHTTDLREQSKLYAVKAMPDSEGE